MDFEIPDELHYTSDDEWVHAEDDFVTLGVTDFAQQQLGDIVYVELPSVGDQLESGVAFGVIESVKTVSDLNAPISGQVVAINEELVDQPEIINEECYGGGWIIKVKPSNQDQIDSLLDADSYRKIVSKRST
ncbi:MAG: glycine cleavage system protein GcvH [Deltaproteobacteria bacterium]|nr:glycine cleavage system protein GcvH [Deltaproteobacteria bacterium]